VRSSEQRYRAMAEEAERAGRVKDQFLAVLSHELRTPLSPVLLTISLLESHPELPPALRESVASARRNIELEARLIDDLLDLTRIARGKIKYAFQPLDLHDVIRGAIATCCTDGKLAVHTNYSAERATVRGDSARLQQIFCNLLGNAWKFTAPGGAVTIATENAGDCIRVEVTDTGAGIEPDVLPRIFDAFEQGDPVRARRFGGLGLGLAIAKALVDAHGGLISAWSDGAGCGARFRVELPIAAATPADSNGSIDNPRPAADPRRLRMLLVEDHPSTLAALERLLKAVGHEVHGVSCVTDALQATRNSHYDLVISDLGLPDGTGYELMHQLRVRHNLRGIALSGFGMEEDITRSREAGFADHLVKPIDLQKLQAAIERAVSG
jgi:CheY-like chemotaxis protein